MKKQYNKLGVDRLEEWLKFNYPTFYDTAKEFSRDDSKTLEDIEDTVMSLAREVEKTSNETGIFRGVPLEELGAAEVSTLTTEVSIVFTPSLFITLMMWFKNKQAFVFDQALADSLNVNSGDNIPVQVLDKLPYDCFYIECDIDEYQGFLISKKWDVYHVILINKNIEYYDVLTMSIINFKDISSFENINDMMLNSIRGTRELLVQRYQENLMNHSGEPVLKSLKRQIENLVPGSEIYEKTFELSCKVFALLIYIASKEPEIVYVYDRNKSSKKYKKQSTKSNVHEVGFKLGKSLNQMMRKVQFENRPQYEKTSKKVATHIRRAHWHTYWVGPKDKEQEVEIKWIEPCIINGTSDDLRKVAHVVS